MKGYKGFEPGLVCKGKQYAEDTVFKELKAKICEAGMHFCENPFDVLDYYSIVNQNAEFNDFAKVEAVGDVKTNDGKKFCTTKLKIGAKLSFAGFVKACVDFVIEKSKIEENKLNGDYAQIVSSGNCAQIGSSGNYAQINCEGKHSVVCCADMGSVVKAKKGCWITLSEWEYSDEEKTHIPVCVKTEFVDGERIKENTFYKLQKGEFVEVMKNAVD